MKQIIRVDGMSCHHCEMRVERALKELSGVKKAHANHMERTCIIESKDAIPEDILREKIKQAGYTVTAVEE